MISALNLSVRAHALDTLSFAKSLCLKLKAVLPVWRKFFGLGLQADSSTGERCSLSRHEPSSAGLQAKAFGHHKMALESTLPLHNDDVARRVSERIESCFRAQSELRWADQLACPSRVRDASCHRDNRAGTKTSAA
jgi:hypothetical protein